MVIQYESNKNFPLLKDFCKSGNSVYGPVAELVDAADLKSVAG